MAALQKESLLIDFDDYDWLALLDADAMLNAGERAPDSIEVPQKDAQAIVSSVVRLVLDLPRRSTPLVVWSAGDNEVLVHSERTTITCSSGVITLSTVLECDQCKPVTISIPIGVGTRQAPGGLIMTTFIDVAGPSSIVDVWSDSLQAFAWETVLETARIIAAQVGKDSRGRPLVPGSIGAAPRTLLIQPVARHSLKAGL